MKKIISVIAITMALLNIFAFSPVNAGDISNPVFTSDECLAGCSTYYQSMTDMRNCFKTETDHIIITSVELETEQALAGL